MIINLKETIHVTGCPSDNILIFLEIINLQFRFFSKPTWTPKNSLFEKDIGVTEYIGTAPGFTGVIKARYCQLHYFYKINFYTIIL